MAESVIRTGAALDSPKVSGRKLAVGQEIEVLEQRALPEGTLRLRFARGWVSETVRNTTLPAPCCLL